MKTKQFVTVIIFACAVLFATHSAQAFYNPNTGRWLSRDPIEEEGGLDVYAFVKNSSPVAFDAFGLSENPCNAASCDKAVDGPLSTVLNEVNSTFNKWDPWRQRASCLKLVDFNGGANKAWDIKELRAYGSKQRTGCSRQVTFRGNCYFGGAVNYAMFGFAIRKCNKAMPWDLRFYESSMVAGIIYHKLQLDGFFGNIEAMQAVTFAIYGWTEERSFPWQPRDPPTCSPNSEADKRVYKWMWRPFKNFDN